MLSHKPLCSHRQVWEHTLPHSHILMDLSLSAEPQRDHIAPKDLWWGGYEEGNVGDEMWDHGEEDRHLGRSQKWQAHQIGAMI